MAASNPWLKILIAMFEVEVKEGIDGMITVWLQQDLTATVNTQFTL